MLSRSKLFIKFGVYIIVLGLFIIGMCGSAFASYTTLATGDLGTSELYPALTCLDILDIMSANESIVSVTLKYWSAGAYTSTADIYEELPGSRAQLVKVASISCPNTSPVTTTINFSDKGDVGFRVAPTGTSGKDIYVDVVKVQYREYSIDGTTLYMGSDGYVHAQITNTTPNSSISYQLINGLTNQSGTVANNTSSVNDVMETSCLSGKQNPYSLYWGFCGGVYPISYSFYVDKQSIGSIFVPVDIDVTDSINYIKNDLLSTSGGIVQDSSGTVLTAARAANTAASNANTNAVNAYNAANTAASRTIYSGQSSAYWGYSAYYKANSADTNALNAYTTAQTVNTKVDNLQNSVNSINSTITSIVNSDTVPPAISLSTLSGAVATSGTSIQIIVDVSDNVSTTFTYSLDGTSYSSLPSNGVLSVPITNPGSNLIDVWVKDQAGNTAKKSIIIRKL